MNERLARAEALFHEACERAPEEREAFLRQSCGEDTDLLREVTALLRAAGIADQWLKDSDCAAAEADLGSSLLGNISEGPGTVVGRYKLLEKIGEGGFGVVYMAEQAEPVHRKVALKIIKLGMDTRQVIARFEAEGQALALMDHPNIAKVLDAGATDTGRPYFVMELVRGVPVTRFCEENQLGTTERLELFIQVCHAVQHAHQKGVIHRDLKPTNVLVTLNDGVPHPMLIDFGVAKAINQRLTEKTLFTNFALMIGTPAYMSPEQAEMSKLDVDTRSDIYSLGVLLYELLTGTTPFPEERLRSAGYVEMQRIICEEKPPRPSTRITRSSGPKAHSSLATRHSPLSSDLDWIVMKCLEKDRTRRYETANGLAMELQRHLNNEPVVARPPSKLYAFQKTVRRHKVGFAATMAIIFVLAAGVVVSTWQAVRARRAEQAQIRLRREAEAAREEAQTDAKQARTEAAKSQQVAQFLQDMLAGVGPSAARGRDTTMLREILDRTARHLDALTNQPAVEAELRATLGGVYYDLGQFAQAEAMQRQVLALRTRLFGPESLAVADAQNDLGNTLHVEEKFHESEASIRTALAVQQKLLGPTNNQVAATLRYLGSVLRAEKKNAEAEVLLRRALAMRKALPGNENLEVAAALDELGVLLAAEGKNEEAETNFFEALAIRKKLLPAGHPKIATSMTHLGKTLARLGKNADAEAFLRGALDIQRNVLSSNHRDRLLTVFHLALVLQAEGKAAEAEPLFRQAANAGNVQAMNILADMANSGRGVATNHPEALKWRRKAAENGSHHAQFLLGQMYQSGQGVARNPVEAEKWFLKAAESGYPQAMDSLGEMNRLGRGVATNYSEALKWYRKAAESRDHRGEYYLGRMYWLGQGVTPNAAEAVKWLRKSAAQNTILAECELVHIYRSGDRVPKNAAEAEIWQRKLTESKDPEAWNDAAWLFATSSSAKDRDARMAMTLAQKAVALTSRTNANFVDTLAAAYAETGQFTNAVKVEKEAIALLTDTNQTADFTTRLNLYQTNTPCREP